MNKNQYNSNDVEHQHVINLLKELPKEKAPDNFEYNLSVKIKNKNFGLNSKETKFLFPWKVFVPATGLVTAALLLFFTFFSESETFENPFQLQPKLRSELRGDLQNKTNSVLENKNIISANDVIINKKAENEDVSQSSSLNKSIVTEIKNKKPNFPFNNSTNLDEVIASNSQGSISNRASLTGRNDLRSSFNGFYIRNEVDKAYVEALKARMDSIKRDYRNNQRKGDISK